MFCARRDGDFGRFRDGGDGFAYVNVGAIERGGGGASPCGRVGQTRIGHFGSHFEATEGVADGGAERSEDVRVKSVELAAKGEERPYVLCWREIDDEAALGDLLGDGSSELRGQDQDDGRALVGDFG